MNIPERFKKITTFVFDIDGVLTDGTLLLLKDGLQVRQMHIKDGLGLQMALNNGYTVVAISGGASEESRIRLLKLGVKDVYLKLGDKKQFLSDYIKEHDLSWQEILYMGDDLPDLSLMNVVGMPCCPADAVNEIKETVKYISPFNGGCGCVRDVIEKVLKLNNHWNYHPGIHSR
ncbi:MAG TPA: HAD hydrolase family protein [Chitinophagaceae bacterium]|nr:HAD hydrolase family protein [Chitinophagaceae bacterium]